MDSREVTNHVGGAKCRKCSPAVGGGRGPLPGAEG